MNWALRRLLALWVRYTIRPEDAALHIRSRSNPVCYVLERYSFTDLAVLQNASVKLKLPRPHKRLMPQASDLRSFFYLSQPRGFWDARPDRRPPAPLIQAIGALRLNEALDVDLVPVAVYWGRAPQKEVSLFRLLLVEDWALTSRLRKFFQVLFNGRATLIEIDDPVSLRSLLGNDADVAVQSRRVARAMRALFRRQRAARIGPDLSHRRTLVARVLRSRAVLAAVSQEMIEKKISRQQALRQAEKIAEEIAANYSHAFVRFLYHLFTWLWNRLYDGVIFEHVETLARVAEGREVVYVPCHRSHMDYLLLSYAIYHEGYAIPHIAAGINLNMPIVGRFLRKGGAFFIRRSFRGSALYTVAFMSYLAAIMARGHSIEYFIEGGRSRTGRLLQPKTGMLSMTVRSYLRDPTRPVVFVPVYFGYERIVEGSTYIGELSGKPKEKESVSGLLRTLKKLRERFGQVHVNIGEPIELDQLLEAHGLGGGVPAPNGDDDGVNRRALASLVEELAQRIMVNINAAAAVTPISLLSITLLAAPRQALSEADLLRQLDLYLSLLRSFSYSDRVTITPLTPSDILSYGEAMKAISREKHALGDIVRMEEDSAVLATYFRNNVLHLFAIPSLIACAFGSNATLRTEDIQRLAWRIYPYVASELFLRWTEEELPRVVSGVLEVMAEHHLIEADHERAVWHRPPPTSGQAVQLSLLAQATIQTIERYYVAVASLLHAGSGQITQAALEQRCQLMAQRITMLYGINSPEFFDRSLFEHFIDLLRARGVVRVGSDGKLEFNEVLMRVAEDAQLVLNEQIRHSILQVTHA
jgi:glycerol-3-phosphate O-acyltransferase